MICQECLEEVEPQEGKEYTFYYGIHTTVTPKSTRYNIRGSEKLFLCESCVFAYTLERRVLIYRGWSIFFVVVACAGGCIIQFGSDGSSGVLPWLGIGLVLAYAAALFMMSVVEKKRMDEHQDFALLSPALRALRGSDLAIAIRKADLQEQGYSSFFTPQRLKRMTRLQTPALRKKQAEGKAPGLPV